MKALRLYGPGELRLVDEPEPAPADDELLLRVTAVGLCGSDRHWVVEGSIGDATLARPLVLGHEFAATIQSGPRAGERVAVDPADPCRRCAVCRAGLQHLCPTLRFAGHGSTDGALRTLIAWPSRLVHAVPDLLTDAEAALLEPLGVALHAVDLGHVRPGTTAGVFGCGPLGILLVQSLRAVGATSILATDRLAHRVDAAAALGAERPLRADEARAQLAETAAEGVVDVAFEVAGEDDALACAIDAVRPGGRVVVVGIPDGDRTTFTASAARRKGLTISLCRRMEPADLPRAIRVAGAGRIDLAALVTDRRTLDQWEPAFEHLVERRGLKAVVLP
jgi:L-iditol 2-dehydrogenase